MSENKGLGEGVDLGEVVGRSKYDQNSLYKVLQELIKFIMPKFFEFAVHDLSLFK